MDVGFFLLLFGEYIEPKAFRPGFSYNNEWWRKHGTVHCS